MKPAELIFSNHRFRIIWHILFWLAILIYYTFFFGHQGGHYWATLKFMTLLLPVAIGTSYFFNYYLIPKFLLQKKIKSFILLSFYAFVVSFYIISLVIFPFLIINTSEMNFVKLDKTLLDIYFLVVGIYAAILFAIIIKLFKISSQRQQQHLQLLKEKTDAELDALRSQINPHFLFNTLNSIYTLSLKKSDKTAEVVLKLSEMLDYLLYRCNEDQVTLKNEIKLIENYLFVQKIRFEKRLKIDFIIHGNVDGQLISPMLLLPFIENSIKHGTAKSRKSSWIDINLLVGEEQMEFEVSNSKSDAAHNTLSGKSGGIGLKNVRKRLDLFYNKGYDLAVNDGKNEFNVKLIIKTT